jgi:hypothetical protein
MNYKHGGAHNSDGSKRGFWDNVHAKRNRGESPDKSKVSSDTAKRFNLANGGMEKYFMGGMQGMIDPRDQALYGQGVDRRSGYSLADGGVNPYDYMMGGKKLYPHGGSHIPVNPNIPALPANLQQQNPGTITQGRDKMSFGEKAWDVITNPLTAFKQYGKYGELQDNFQNMEPDSALETVTEFINPAAVADMLYEYGKSVKNEGMTTENLAQGAFMLAFRKRMPNLKGADLKQQANKLWNKVKKNEMWANPLGGWKGDKMPLKGVKENIDKVVGKPGNYTVKSSTPVLTYKPRTKKERFKNVIKKSGKLAAVYGPSHIGYNMATSETDTSKTMDYSGLGDGDFSILTGTQDSPANTINPDTIPLRPSAELEDLGTTDSIPYTAVGDTLNIEGGNWRRLEDSADGNMNWEQID